MRKHILSAIIGFCAFGAFAQVQPYPANLIQHARPSQSASDRETIIWSEDFGNGLPSSWLITSATPPATWEYRGPLTNPNFYSGSQGSCSMVNGQNGPHIVSESWQNGFMIFDSNFWDFGINSCVAENSGLGPAPGPHYATLETPSIDISAYSYAALSFHQFFYNYNATTSVQMSINGGEWVTIYTNNMAVGDLTELTDVVRFVIPTLGNPVSDLKLRWVFQGTNYNWQIDDIKITDVYNYDLLLKNTTYGDYNFNDPTHPTGFEYLEYSQYPNEFPPLLRLSGTANNYGVVTQTDIRLNASVYDQSGTLVGSAQSTEGFIAPMSSDVSLRAGAIQMPATIGEYDVEFTTSSFEGDENQNNNLDTLHFAVTDIVYARDRGDVQALYQIEPGFSVYSIEVGNVFVMPVAGQSVHSLTTAFGLGTLEGVDVYAAIYDFNLVNGAQATLVAQSAPIFVTAGMINNFTDEILTTIPFATPVALQNGHAYLAVIGTSSPASTLVIGMNGDAPTFSSWLRYYTIDQYRTLPLCPIVRMNFGLVINTEEVQAPTATISAFPNPCSDQLNVRFSKSSESLQTLRIIDALGNVVMTKRILAQRDGTITLDTTSLSAGIYSVCVGEESLRIVVSR